MEIIDFMNRIMNSIEYISIMNGIMNGKIQLFCSSSLILIFYEIYIIEYVELSQLVPLIFP